MKRELWITVLAVLVLFVVAWVVYSPTGDVIMNVKGEGYIDISSSDAFVLINDNPDIIIIDVSPNYYYGHLPGAINYYVGDGSLDAAIPMLDSDAQYLVYCHFDSASRAGAQKLIDAGFTKVYRLTDHFVGWKDSGYPVEY